MVHPTSAAKAARYRPGCGQPRRVPRLGLGGVYFRAVYLGFGRKRDADHIIVCWRFCAQIPLRSSPLSGPARQRTWLAASRLWISSCRMLIGGLYVRSPVILPDGLVGICGKGIEQHVEL